MGGELGMHMKLCCILTSLFYVAKLPKHTLRVVLHYLLFVL